MGPEDPLLCSKNQGYKNVIINLKRLKTAKSSYRYDPRNRIYYYDLLKGNNVP